MASCKDYFHFSAADKFFLLSRNVSKPARVYLVCLLIRAFKSSFFDFHSALDFARADTHSLATAKSSGTAKTTFTRQRRRWKNFSHTLSGICSRSPLVSFHQKKQSLSKINIFEISRNCRRSFFGVDFLTYFGCIWMLLAVLDKRDGVNKQPLRGRMTKIAGQIA